MASSSPPSAPLTLFPQFPHLPTELQLKILHHASHLVPRTIDIWTDWKRCTHANTIFYIQHYTSLLTSSASVPPVLLSVSRDARKECWGSYSREFESTMTVSTSRDTDASADIEAKSETRTEITVTMPATLYLNPSIDTLAPRGFWNIISFSDFCSRISSLGLHTIAIDASGCFWRENLKDYCRRRCWVLNGVREVLIYDSMGVGELKGSEYLERFRERVVEKRELSFVELEEEVDGVEGEGESEQVRKVRDVERFLGKVFDVIESEGDVEGDEEFGDVRKAEFVSMEPTEKSEFRRPVVRLVRLVTEAAG